MTATELDPLTNEVKPVGPARWRQLKSQYDQIAAAHARICKCRDANQWLRSRK